MASHPRLGVRRATQNDVESLVQLASRTRQDFTTQFGAFSFAHLIEASILAVVVHDEAQQQPVGFAAFLDAPPPSLQIGLLSQDQWPNWLNETFVVTPEISTAITTAWMVALVMDASVDPVYLGDQILHTAFATLPHVEAVLALVPLEAVVASPVVERFRPLEPKSQQYFGPRTFYCSRSAFIPPVQTRRARVEDHDDIVPILNEQTEVLTQIYGEFFLASVIENQNDHNVVLVADAGGASKDGSLNASTTNVRAQGRSGDAVGIVSVTDLVDVKLLNACFDLSPYDYLLKNPEAAGIANVANSSSSSQSQSSQGAASQQTAAPESTTTLQRRMDELYYRFVEAFGGATFRELVGLAALACDPYATTAGSAQPKGILPGLDSSDIPLDLTAMSDADVLKVLDAVDGSNLFALAALSVDSVNVTTTNASSDAAGGKQGDGLWPSVVPSQADTQQLVRFRLKLDRAQAIALPATRAAATANPAELASPAALIGAGAAEEIGSVTGSADSVWLDASGTAKGQSGAAGHTVRDNLYSALIALIEQFVASNFLQRTFTEHGVAQSGPRVHLQQAAPSTQNDAPSKRLIVVPYSAPPMYEVVKAAKDNGGFGYRASQTARAAETSAQSVLTAFQEPIITSNPKINAALDYLSEIMAIPAHDSEQPQSQQQARPWSRTLFVETISKVSELLTGALPSAFPRLIAFLEAAVRTAYVGPDGIPEATRRLQEVLKGAQDGQPKPAANAANHPGPQQQQMVGQPTLNEDDADSESEEEGESGSEQLTSLAEAQADPWAPNAVAITLYCIDEAYEPRAIDLIAPIFAHFPHIEYCVLTQPHTSPERGLLKYFVPVPPKPSSTLNHTLYIIHRNAIKPRITVGWSEVFDVFDFARMLSYTSPSSSVVGAKSSSIPASQQLIDLRNQLVQYYKYAQEQGDPAAIAKLEPLCFSLSALLDAAGIVPGSRAAGLLAQVEAALLDEKLQRSLFYQEKEQRKQVRRRFAQLPKPKSGLASNRTEHQTKDLADVEQISAEERLEYKTARPKRRKLASFTIRAGDHPESPVIGFAIVTAIDQSVLNSLASGYSIGELVAMGPLIQWNHDRHVGRSAFDRDSTPKSIPFAATGPIAAELVALVINPLFARSTGLVCQEIMRLFHKDILLLRVPADAPNVCDIRPLEVFVQTRPRQVPSPAPAALLKGSGDEIPQVDSRVFANSRFALHVATRRLLAMPKARINARIVVVGASDTSLGFLEALALNPDVHCSSLTLVSPDGLPYGRRAPPGVKSANKSVDLDDASVLALPLGEDPQAQEIETNEKSDTIHGDSFLPWSLSFSSTHLAKLALDSRILVLHEALVSLDASAQEIILSSGRLLPYDFLVIGTGLQDCTARRLGVDVDVLIRGEDFKTAQELLLPMLSNALANAPVAQTSNGSAAAGNGGNTTGAAAGKDSSAETSKSQPARPAGPICVGRSQGLWTIPTEAAAQAFARHILRQRPRFIAVVGCTLQALTAIQGMLKLGIKPSSILWIHEDGAAAASWCDGDRVVASQLLRVMIDELGIQVMPRTRLAAVRVDENGQLNEIVLERLPDQEGANINGGVGPAESNPSLGKLHHRSSTSSLLTVGNASGAASTSRLGGESSTSSLDTAASTGSLYSTQSFFFTLECQCVLTTSEPDIDPRMVQAFLENSFVQDGRLVVNHHFSIASTAVGASSLGGGLLARPPTFTPHFAAGPICRFSKRYGATPPMSQFDSREVGHALAQSVLRAIEASMIVPDERSLLPNPTGETLVVNSRTNGWSDLDEGMDQQSIELAEVAFRRELCAKHGIPPGTDLNPTQAPTGALREKLNNFWQDYNRARRMHAAGLLRSKLPALGTKPKTITAELPGGLVYARITQAASLATSGVGANKRSDSLTQDSYVDDIALLTNDRGRVCRLVIDGVTQQVKSFVYIGPTSIPTYDLARIVGLPATYLNNILQRYRRDQVKDLISELTQPWAAVIQHEAFGELRSATSAALADYLAREPKDTPVPGRRDLIGHFEMLISSIVKAQTTLENKAKEVYTKGQSSASSPATAKESPSSSSSTEGGSDATELARLADEVQSIIGQAVTNMHMTTRHTVQTKLLEFIYQNADHLPGFQIPPSMFKASNPE